MARRRDDEFRYLRDISASAFRVLRGFLTNALATVANAGAAIARAAGEFYRWLSGHFPNDDWKYREALDLVSHQYQSNQASEQLQSQLYSGDTATVSYPVNGSATPGIHIVAIWTGQLDPGQGQQSIPIFLDFPTNPTSEDILNAIFQVLVAYLEDYEIENEGQLERGTIQITRAEQGA